MLLGIDLKSHCGTLLDYVKIRAILPDRTKDFINMADKEGKICNRQ